MAIITCNQLSLADVFSDCQDIYESDKPEFLSLLQSNINLDEIIPDSFRNHFYASTGRSRKYPLHAFLWALIIQRIFSIPTDSLLLVFLNYCFFTVFRIGFLLLYPSSACLDSIYDLYSIIQLYLIQLIH